MGIKVPKIKAGEQDSLVVCHAEKQVLCRLMDAEQAALQGRKAGDQECVVRKWVRSIAKCHFSPTLWSHGATCIASLSRDRVLKGGKIEKDETIHSDTFGCAR